MGFRYWQQMYNRLRPYRIPLATFTQQKKSPPEKPSPRHKIHIHQLITPETRVVVGTFFRTMKSPKTNVSRLLNWDLRDFCIVGTCLKLFVWILVWSFWQVFFCGWIFAHVFYKFGRIKSSEWWVDGNCKERVGVLQILSKYLASWCFNPSEKIWSSQLDHFFNEG